MNASIANSLWLAASLPAAIKFRRALPAPESTQAAVLQRILRENLESAFGQAHDFHRIKNYADFKQRIPLHDYDELQPWIDRIKRGEARILTREPVTHFAPTSGSTGARKLIPFTASLQREFNQAIGPWITDLFQHHSGLMPGPAYWSISPATEGIDQQDSVVPVGFDDDTTYLGGIRKRLVSAVMAVPDNIRHITDMNEFRYITLLHLLRHPDLRLISVWHPSFLSLLLDALPGFWNELLQDIQHGTRHGSPTSPARPRPKLAARLRRVEPRQTAGLWPHLKLVSCWGDGHARLPISELAQRFPQATIQAKGLLATEAFVSIPYAGTHPLAVTSHFFEFIDDGGSVHLAHELQKDGIYEVAVTTSGGMWRYRLHDQVQVTGFLGKTPALTFLGRKGNVSDLFGEKLSETFVSRALQQVLARSSPPKFTLVAADKTFNCCHYTLYMEGETTVDVATLLENILLENPHYAWCRKLDQLKPLRVFRIKASGYEAFAERSRRQGKRLGDIKPVSLSLETGWSELFEGEYVDAINQPTL